MSTTISDLESPVSESTHPMEDLSLLEDRFPEAWKMSWHSAAWAILIAVMFVFFSHQPLWHTDLWGHVSYGRHIAETGRIPATEPLMPLSEGVPFVDSAWLSQLAFYGLETSLGTAGLKFIYAATIAIMLLILTIRLRDMSHRVVITALGLMMFLVCEWKSMTIIRPQLFALCWFLALIGLTQSRGWSRSGSSRFGSSQWRWFAVPALMTLWANMHGSFVIGLGYLGCLFVGRFFDALVRTRSLKFAIQNTAVFRTFVLVNLAIVACLINPYGIRLYEEVLTFGNHPNLQAIVEWDALTLRMFQGKAALASALLLLVVYRWSPRRVGFAEPLLLCGLGIAMLNSSRLIVWWAPLAAWYFALHASAIWKQRGETLQLSAPERSGRWTVITAACLWICFAITPMGYRVLHGAQTDPEQRQAEFEAHVSDQTPVEAVAYLHEHPPQGLLFNTYEWGDYLLYAGPEDTQVFLASHAHLVPPEIWRHYLRIQGAGTGWDDLLDRYGIDTIIVDHQMRSHFISRLKLHRSWELEYSDSVAAIFVRKNRTPIPPR